MERVPKAWRAMLVLAACVAVANANAARPSNSGQAASAWSAEGLQAVDASGFDLAYIRPGGVPGRYRAVALTPVQVHFKRGWERGAAIPAGTRLHARDLRTIRESVARVVRERVARELEQGGYVLVDAPGADTLVLDLDVVDLYLNAPDLPTIRPTDTYAIYFGELTIVGSLRDPRSGEIVMRALDHTMGREYLVPRLTTEADNLHEIGSAAGNWGRALGRQLALAGLAPGGSNDRP